MRKTDSVLCQDLILNILQRKPSVPYDCMPKLRLREIELQMSKFNQQRQLLRSNDTEVLQMGRTYGVLQD